MVPPGVISCKERPRDGDQYSAGPNTVEYVAVVFNTTALVSHLDKHLKEQGYSLKLHQALEAAAGTLQPQGKGNQKGSAMRAITNHFVNSFAGKGSAGSSSSAAIWADPSKAKLPADSWKKLKLPNRQEQAEALNELRQRHNELTRCVASQWQWQRWQEQQWSAQQWRAWQEKRWSEERSSSSTGAWGQPGEQVAANSAPWNQCGQGLLIGSAWTQNAAQQWGASPLVQGQPQTQDIGQKNR